MNRPLRAALAAALVLSAPGLAPYQALALQVSVRNSVVRAPIPVFGPRFGLARVPSTARHLDAAPHVWGQTSNLSPAVNLMSGTLLPVEVVKLTDGVGAQVQLMSAKALLQPVDLSPSRWDRFWSGNRAKREEAAIRGSESSLPQTLARPQKKTKTRLMANAALLAVPVAAGETPGWVSAVWEQAQHFAPAAIALVGTYAVVRIARSVIDSLAKAFKWDPAVAVPARMLLSIALWTGGLALTMNLAGASMVAVYSTLAVGGLVLLPIVKDLLGNFMEGVKVLAGRPFLVGDKIQVGGERFTVKDMGLRHLELQGDGSGVTFMTYAKVAQGAVTVFREYETSRELVPAPRRALRGFLRLLKEAAAPDLRKTALWTAAGVGLLIGLPWLKDYLSLGAFDAAFPYLQGASALWVTRNVSRWAGGLIERVGKKYRWEPQAVTLTKLAGSGLVWMVGGGLALGAFGLGWPAVLASLGLVPAAIAIASSDIVGNLVQGFLLLLQRPFVVGDVITADGATGKVVDMSLQYIVLRHEDGAHTLVPHSVVRDDPFTVFPADQAKTTDTSAPKPKEK